MNPSPNFSRLPGRVIRPDDPGWDAARQGFAARADYDANRPQAVAFCRDAEEVAGAVCWARDNRLPLRARSGRHHYEAHSSLAAGGLILDTGALDSVRIDTSSGTVTAGAGVCMLPLSDALGHAGLALPLATGAGVGLAGLTLGGGFGITSRKWGLTCDSLTAMDIALAGGAIETISAERHPDLFWACRGGGGGNFGVATAFTFAAHPARQAALLDAEFHWSAFEAVVARFQEWMADADPSVTAFLTLLGTRQIRLQGQYTPAPAASEGEAEHAAAACLAPMLDDPRLELMRSDIQAMPHPQAARTLMEIDPATPDLDAATPAETESQWFKSTSAFVYDPLPARAVSRLRRALETVPPLTAPPSQPSMVQLLGGGGQIARVDPAATAAYHRRARLLVQYNAYWTAPQDAATTLAWIDTLRRALSPDTRGAYVNYIDTALADPLSEYYGPNLARLREIKRAYDPDNFFTQPHGIPPLL